MKITNVSLGGTLSTVEWQNGVITGVQAGLSANADLDAQGLKMLPGLIDIHTHGRRGVDTMDAELESLAVEMARVGTTTFLPTTMTASEEAILRVTEQDTRVCGARVEGFHLEGPFIARSAAGAQNPDDIRVPTAEEYEKYRNVAMITLAPELDGAIDFIRGCDATVAIGHTKADCDTAAEAIRAGAKCLTHTCNAMPPLLHRAPGPIGAALTEDAYAQLICDGIHVSRPMVLALYRMFGKDRLVLISDSIRPAGMPLGDYECGGLTVHSDGECHLTLADGTLAGCGLSLLECVRTAIDMGIPEEDAVYMASATPAELLGIKRGRIEVGYDADFLLVSDDLTLKAVYIKGEKFDI